VTNSSTADGGNVQQWTANGTNAQQWIITATTDGHYKLENKGSNKALEVSNNSLADGATCSSGLTWAPTASSGK
jgi:hypothetical protein